MSRIGAHISIAGGVKKALERAEAIGCEALQIFARNPRGWRASSLAEDQISLFRHARKRSGLFPLIVHSPYLINLSAPDPEIYHKSLAGFRQDIIRASALGADGYVVHVGFHKGKGRDAGIMAMAKSLKKVLGQISPPVPRVLLENTASAGSALGHRFENIAEIMAESQCSEHLGFCLDTCHAFVAGYDISRERGLEETITRIDNTIGLEQLALVHFNDSRHPLGSHRDGHAHIGEGWIGLEAMKRIFLHPGLAAAAFILETPKTSPHDDLRNLSLVRSWREDRD